MTNLVNFKNAVETRWEGVTPASDGSTSAYRFIDDYVEERGNGQHRELIWRLSRRSKIIGEHEEEQEWIVPCELFIHRTPPGQPERTYEAFVNAVEAEAWDLAQSFGRMGSGLFDQSVIGPILDDFTFRELEPTRPQGSGGVPRSRVAVVTFNFRVLIFEN